MDMVKHLLSRNYDPSRYMNQVIDFENEILTVYLNNLSGEFVGFQQYNPNVTAKKVNNAKEGRYFTYSQRGVNACWGLETLDYAKNDLYLVEGVFKASSLHMLGCNALALLTSHPKPMKSWLHTLPFNLIGIGDNDKAGRGMMAIARKGFQMDDLDEFKLDELNTMIKSAKIIKI